MEESDWEAKVSYVRGRVRGGTIEREEVEHALAHVSSNIGQAILLLMLKGYHLFIKYYNVFKI